jgi:hypothetical protein
MGLLQMEREYDRSQRRMYHGSLQFIAAACIIAGYFVAFAANLSGGAAGEFAIGDDALHVLHVWLGYLTILGIIMQVIVGIYKMILKAQASPVTCAQWHGVVGPAIFALGLLTAMLGCSFWFTDENNNITGQGVCLILALLSVAGFTLAELFCCPAVRKTAGHGSEEEPKPDYAAMPEA